MRVRSLPANPFVCLMRANVFERSLAGLFAWLVAFACLFVCVVCVLVRLRACLLASLLVCVLACVFVICCLFLWFFVGVISSLLCFRLLAGKLGCVCLCVRLFDLPRVFA